MTLMQSALNYAGRGLHVFPVQAGANSPPLVPRWQELATRHPVTLEEWWSQWPDANIGIACGLSGIAVIDIDPGAQLSGLHDSLGFDIREYPTIRARTPRGGWHIYFRVPDGMVVKNSQSKLAPKVDVRGDGGYVVASPSVRTDGAYEWAPPLAGYTGLAALPVEVSYELQRIATPVAPQVAEPQPLPEVTQRTDRWAQAALEGELQAVATEPEGNRNGRLFIAGLKLFGIVKGGYLDQHDVDSRLYHVAVTSAGQTEREARMTLRSAWERSTPRGPEDWDVAPDLVDLPPMAQVADDGGPTLPLYGVGELANFPPPTWVLPGRVPFGLTWLIGRPKTFKSFVALDWAAATAASGQRVIYCIGEGVYGFAHRVVSWHNAYPQADVAPLKVAPRMPNLMSQQSVETWYRTLARYRPKLVVLDTWSRGIPGANENDHGPISAAIDMISQVQESLECSLLVVHHTNASDARARGHSAIEGAADAVWHLSPTETNPLMIEAENTAIKDFERQPSFVVELIPQPRSAVISPTAFMPKAVR